VANNVRFYRVERGLTQKEFAEAVGMCENSVYLLERPEAAYTIPLVTLATVAHALNLPVGAMLVPRETQPNPRGQIARTILSRKRQQYEVAHHHDHG